MRKFNLILRLSFGILVGISMLNCNNNSLKSKIEENKQRINIENWQFKFDTIKSINNRFILFNIGFLLDPKYTEKGIVFYRFISDNHKDRQLFLGIRNDTIFCYDSKIDFFDIFLVLDKTKKRYLSRIGDDYGCELVSSTKLEEETRYLFKFDTIKYNIIDDVINIRNPYPNLVFKEFYISDLRGFLNIKLMDKKNKITYDTNPTISLK